MVAPGSGLPSWTCTITNADDVRETVLAVRFDVMPADDIMAGLMNGVIPAVA
jgi:hypothetical protein